MYILYITYNDQSEEHPPKKKKNQHPDISHLHGGCIILSKDEVLTNADFTKFDRNKTLFAYRKIFHLLFQSMENKTGAKTTVLHLYFC